MKVITKLIGIILFLSMAELSALACPDVDGLVDINCDGKVQIAAFGNSITFGRSDSTRLGYPGRLNLLFPNTVVVNLGVPGENTNTGRSRAARSFPQIPDTDYAIVLEGVNDYWLDNPSPSRTKSNVLSIVRSAQNIGAISLLGNLTQIRRKFQRSWVSRVNSQINPHSQIDFFSLGDGIISSDLIHPHNSGYQEMAELAAGILLLYSEANRPVDTDADNMYDFAEPRFGTDPLIPDTDGDGLLDGDEVFIHGSSPLELDSDGDGFGDYQEVMEMGSDPGDPRPTAPTLQTLEVILPEEG